MELNQLHFSHPLWLWAGVAIPLIWAIYFLYRNEYFSAHRLHKFIDSHLLPHLLMKKVNKNNSYLMPLLLWTTVWALLILGLAGPRWNFREIEVLGKDQNLIILLDLSESMNAADVKPSRLVKAKQIIEDLINHSKGVKIGLIVFAAGPHMIIPLTEDKETIRHLLPTLETDIIYIQGSRLSPALDMAANMLESESSHNRAILVISDGGYEDSGAIITAKQMAEKGINIYVMGIGTIEGAPIKDHQGNLIKKESLPIVSKLEVDRLREISNVGKGRYLNYLSGGEEQILNDLEKRSEAQLAVGKKNRLWDEQFYFLIVPALPIILWWFKRGRLFSLCFLFLFPSFDLSAAMRDYFKNSDQHGQELMEKGDYESAATSFKDSYRKGISYYRAGQYAKAEEMFRQSIRPEVAASANYNLGNALAQQQKLKEAVVAYEEVLLKCPDHLKAKDNLEIVKQLLNKQQQEQSSDSNSDSQKDKDQKSQENEKQNNKKNDTNDSGKSDKSDQPDTNENESSQSQQDKEDNLNNSDKESSNSEEQKNQEAESREAENAAEDTNQEEMEQKEIQKESTAKSEKDQDADQWLNRISNDPKSFMKNKLYIESKKNGTREGIDPW